MIDRSRLAKYILSCLIQLSTTYPRLQVRHWIDSIRRVYMMTPEIRLFFLQLKHSMKWGNTSSITVVSLIQPIRDGLNLARATHDFAPHRDEFCLVHPKLSTQNSNAIKIKGSDVFQGGFNAINGRKCKDPPDSTDPNFHSTLVHSHFTSALRFPLSRSLCHSVAVRFGCD